MWITHSHGNNLYARVLAVVRSVFIMCNVWCIKYLKQDHRKRGQISSARPASLIKLCKALLCMLVIRQHTEEDSTY